MTKDAEFAAGLTEGMAKTVKSNEIVVHLSMLSNPSSSVVWNTDYGLIFIIYDSF